MMARHSPDCERRQGRGCPVCLAATRAALGLPPDQLHRPDWNALEEARKRGFGSPASSPLVDIDAEQDTYAKSTAWIAVAAGAAIFIGAALVIDLQRECPLLLPIACN